MTSSTISRRSSIDTISRSGGKTGWVVDMVVGPCALSGRLSKLECAQRRAHLNMGHRGPYPLSKLHYKWVGEYFTPRRRGWRGKQDQTQDGSLGDNAQTAAMSARSWVRSLFAFVAFFTACSSPRSTPGGPTIDPPPVTPQTVVLVGAGDIADCGNDGGVHARDTGKLLETITSDAIFTAGD